MHLEVKFAYKVIQIKRSKVNDISFNKVKRITRYFILNSIKFK